MVNQGLTTPYNKAFQSEGAGSALFLLPRKKLERRFEKWKKDNHS